MAASRGRGRPGAAHHAGQPACRKSGRRRRRLAGLGFWAAGAAFLSGCVQGPLSALEPASAVTRSVALLWWSMAIGTGVVLLLMVGLAALALRRNAPRAPGRRGLRILLIAGGLMLPSVVIAALLVFGLRLDQAQWPPGARAEAATAFHVDVIAHQWWWEARYPGWEERVAAARADAPGPRSGAARRAEGARTDQTDQADGAAAGNAPLSTVNVMHVPAGVPIHLRIMATDVIHGFWVPRIAGKLDAVPGRVNRLRLMVDEPGEYAGVCAEYCGEGHAGMRFTLIAHPPDELPRRLAELAKEAP